MLHGLWPTRNDGSYPQFCYPLKNLDEKNLTFNNPYNKYFKKPSFLLVHEWNKHGSCSSFLLKEDIHSKTHYYKALNNYFKISINRLNSINLPKTLPKHSNPSTLANIFYRQNPSLPKNSIAFICDAINENIGYLTDIIFCMNKDKSLKLQSCPTSISNQNCRNNIEIDTLPLTMKS